MDTLPTELKYEILETINPIDLKNVCDLDKNWMLFCKSNSISIMRMFLRKYGRKYDLGDSDDLTRTKFKVLLRWLKEEKLYKEEFPKLLSKLVDLAKMVGDNPPSKQFYNKMLEFFLKRKPTKYEIFAMTDVIKYKNANMINNAIKSHIYRYTTTPLGNPFGISKSELSETDMKEILPWIKHDL